MYWLIPIGLIVTITALIWWDVKNDKAFNNDNELKK